MPLKVEMHASIASFALSLARSVIKLGQSEAAGNQLCRDPSRRSGQMEFSDTVPVGPLWKFKKNRKPCLTCARAAKRNQPGSSRRKTPGCKVDAHSGTDRRLGYDLSLTVKVDHFV